MSFPGKPKPLATRSGTAPEVKRSWHGKAQDRTAGTILPDGPSNLAKPRGTVTFSSVRRQNGGETEGDGIEDVDDDDDDGWEDVKKEGDGPLLDIRPCLTADNKVVIDQRNKLKGKDGCLNSRVKQCVRFVRYRERLDKAEDTNRPMKAEAGRYRPFSKTDVRNHAIANPPPTPEQKLQQSVETYQKYVENIAQQTNASSPRRFTFRGHSTGSSRPTIHSSSVLDPDAMLFQSAIDLSKPELANAFSSETTPRPQNSAIYTKDVSAVGSVLDIKRLSPKLSTNRIVPGTRVAHEKQPTPSPENNVEQVVESIPTSSRGDAIVVPMGNKSECPSEYSVCKED